MRKEYIAKIAASTIVLLTGTATSIQIKSPETLGIATLTSLIIYFSAQKTSNIHGRTRKIKIINSTLPNIIEYTALLTVVYYIKEPIILLIAIAIIGLSNSIKKEIKNKLNKEKTIYGRKERVTNISTALIATSINQYFLIYGIMLLAFLTLIDLFYSIYRTTRQ